MSLTDPTLENAAHVVQLALTPVFLLSGIAVLLSVFVSRYASISDQITVVFQDKELRRHPAKYEDILRSRSRALDWAVVLSASAAGLACCAAIALFLVAVRGSTGASVMFWLFGGSLSLTVMSLIAFLWEMILAARGLRYLLSLDRQTVI